MIVGYFADHSISSVSIRWMRVAVFGRLLIDYLDLLLLYEINLKDRGMCSGVIVFHPRASLLAY